MQGQLNLGDISNLDGPLSSSFFISPCRGSCVLYKGTWGAEVVMEDMCLLSHHPIAAVTLMLGLQGKMCSCARSMLV